MAHQIEDNAFVSLREIAWHKLGTVVQEEMNTEEALKLGKLDFEVGKLPNIHRLPDGSEQVSEESFYTYRKDTNVVLGAAVGNRYTPLQNSEMFGVIDEVVESKKLVIETAGALFGGSRVFLTCKVKEPIVVNGNDESYQYLVMANGHDGSLSAMAYFTTIRVVCQNTLNLSLKNCKQKMVIRHTQNIQSRMAEALKILGIVDHNQVVAQELYSRLSKTKMSQQGFFKYIANIFVDESERKKLVSGVPVADALSTRKRNMMDEVLRYAEEGPGQSENQGSAWWGYNAVTGYLSNVRNFKSEDDRMSSLLWGTVADTMHEALVLACEPEIQKPFGIPGGVSFNLN